MSQFTTDMRVPNDEFTVDFHVVSDSMLQYPSLQYSTDFLDRVELRVRHAEVKFLELSDDDSINVEESKVPYIFRINLLDKANEEDLSHIREENYRVGLTLPDVAFRKLNRLILRPHSPLPLIEEQLDTLAEGIYFTVIDLTNGFFHIDMNEGRQKYIVRDAQWAI